MSSSRMRETITHWPLTIAIEWYLQQAEGTRTAMQIAQYMRLMHFVTSDTIRQTLCYLEARGRIKRVKRGVYQA